MTTRWDTQRWEEDSLREINTSKQVGARRRKKWMNPDVDAPISALYIFASDKEPVIRPGAIGIDRAFNQETGSFAEGGNSALGRFKQYNDSNTKPVYPWRAKPWQYVWLRQFSIRDISSAELGIAEQVLHFHIAKAGFRFLGSSCHQCCDIPAAIQVAEAAIQHFQQVAPMIFSWPARVIECPLQVESEQTDPAGFQIERLP